MSTCPNCGSEYADGASCVVCGFEPDTGAIAGVTDDEVEATAPVEHDQDAPGDEAAGAGEADEVEADEVEATGPDRATVAVGASVASGEQPGGSAGPSADRGGHPGPGVAPPPGGATQAPPPGTPPPGGPVGTAVQPAPPQPGALPVTESERNWGMAAHLSSLVASGIGGMGFLGPLIVWLVKKDDSRFVRHHAVEALNFNLSLLLYAVLAIVVGLTVVGLVVAIPAVVVGFVLWFVTSIVAAVKAQRGEAYRYPLTIRLVKE